ncbi:MAG: erythromycin esterase family protein [Bacteriovorax sp.]
MSEIIEVKNNQEKDMNSKRYTQEIIKRANPLRGIDDLDRLINSIKDKKIVMLGESSHGTKEFYEWRTAITKELIANHGFNFIAVEGDWPPCQEITKFIQNKTQSRVEETLSHFSRWPTWMWSNKQVAQLSEWLKNNFSPAEKPVGFYGLDVYSLYESMDKTVELLSKIDKTLSMQAISYYSCFESYRHDEKAYARSLFDLPEGCKKHVLKVLNEILNYRLSHPENKDELLFNAIQNAKIVCNAENYYRAMVLGEEDSWNVRDNHMMDTLSMLTEHYGADSKGIVWEHNTHIGDYRATDMAILGQVNIGGLARDEYGAENVALVGFTTYTGTVIASSAWDGPIKVMPVPKARENSVEAELHNAIPEIGCPDYYLMFNDKDADQALAETRGHRAIGVVYHPPSEHRGNYVPTSLSRRYDALVFIDETHALEPLLTLVDKDKIPETYPYGTHI